MQGEMDKMILDLLAKGTSTTTSAYTGPARAPTLREIQRAMRQLEAMCPEPMDLNKPFMVTRAQMEHLRERYGVAAGPDLGPRGAVATFLGIPVQLED